MQQVTLGPRDSRSSRSLLCRIWRIWSLWGPVSLAALFLPIFMHSFGDVWHLGSEDLESLQVLGPCYLSAFLRSVSGALGGPQCHLLQGSGVSAGSGSLLCRIWRIWSLWGPVSLAALFLPIFMHSLGQSLGPLGGPQCHLLQGSGVSAGSGSLLCRIWRIWSLWGPLSLAALFLPISLCIP